MTEEKRDVEQAFESFRSSPYYVGKDKNGRNTGIAGKIASNKDAEMLRRVYETAYGMFPSEEECNKFVYDFINEWAHSPAIRKDPLRVLNERLSDMFPSRPQEIKAETANMPPEQARQNSMPGSPAMKPGVSADDGKAVREEMNKADVEKELEGQKLAKKKPGNVVNADENLEVSFSEVKRQADVIASITGVPATEKNGKAALKVYKTLETGDAVKCKKAALNVVKICGELYVNSSSSGQATKEWQAAAPYKKYATPIANDEAGLFGMGQSTVGKGTEQELQKKFDEISKSVSNVGSATTDDAMQVIKDIVEWAGKESVWQSTCQENGWGDSLELSKRRYTDGDSSTGYELLFNSAWRAINSAFNNDPKGFVNAYRSVRPWSGSEPCAELDGHTYTWDEFISALDELIKKDTSQKKAEASKNLDQTVIDAASDNALDLAGMAAKNAGAKVDYSKIAEAKETEDK